MLDFSLTRRLIAAALITASPLAITPLAAAAPAEIRPGMTIVDPNGGTVGAVTAVQGDHLIVKTDRHEIRLPLTSFTAHEGKLLFGMTQAQINAETDKALAEAEASLVKGVNVYGKGGTLAGQIEEIDASTVTIKLVSGDLVRLPRSGIAAGANGAVLGLSAAELSQQAAPQPSAVEAEAPPSEASPVATE